MDINKILSKLQDTYSDETVRKNAVEDFTRESGVPLFDDVADFAEELANDVAPADIIGNLDEEDMDKIVLCVKQLFNNEIKESENG